MTCNCHKPVVEKAQYFGRHRKCSLCVSLHSESKRLVLPHSSVTSDTQVTSIVAVTDKGTVTH